MSQTAHETIRHELLRLGDDRNCRILAARDYGSRANNLEHDGSDYDVFFVFAEPPAEYALGRDSDTMQRTIDADDTQLDTEIELHGWSLKKFVGGDGLCGSNPTAMEFVGSPIEYLSYETRPSLFQGMLDEARTSFKPFALMMHYRSLAASNYGKYIESDGDTTTDPTTKRHCNIAQALLRARRVEETHALPPMDANELLRNCAGSDWLPESVYAEIGALFAEKKHGQNNDYAHGHFDLHDWIESELDRDVKTNPKPHVQRQPDRTVIYSNARQMYNLLEWPGV